MEIFNSNNNSHKLMVHHKWTVMNFGAKMESTTPGDFLESDAFRHPADSSSSNWIIRLYPNGSSSNDPSKVAVYLCLKGPTDKHVEKRILFKLCYLDQSSNECYGFFQTKTFVKDVGSTEHSWGFWTTHTNLIQYGVMQADKSAIITCTIHESGGCGGKQTDTSAGGDTLPMELGAGDVLPFDADMQGGLERLRQTATLTDFQFTTEDGTQFKVHKCILAAYSPVFAAMFEGNMKECQNNQLVIVDYKPATIADLLDYIYTRKLPSGEEEIESLLALADKYWMVQLRNCCQKLLVNSISEENVIHLFRLADKHNAPYLRVASSKFVRGSWSAVTKQDDWTKLKAGNPKLAIELLEMAINASEVPCQSESAAA